MESKLTISGPSTSTSAGGDGLEPSHQGADHEGIESLMVSLRAEVPEALLMSMRLFIEEHPNWDQYRLFQAAVAGFLVQNGVQSRDVTRCYLANLFPAQGRFRCG